MRARGVRDFLASGGNTDADAVALLLSTMDDTSVEVLQALYSDPEHLLNIIGADAIIKQLESLLQRGRTLPTDVLCAHVDFLGAIPNQRELDAVTIVFGYLLITKAGFKRSAAVWTALARGNALSDDTGLLNGADASINVDWKDMRGDQTAMAKFNERIVDLMASR